MDLAVKDQNSKMMPVSSGALRTDIFVDTFINLINPLAGT
jgi:hypothetical protein